MARAPQRPKPPLGHQNPTAAPYAPHVAPLRPKTTRHGQHTPP
jgi:hypothetical protein